MNIDEVSSRKRQTELKIIDLVIDFQKETGLRIASIDLDSIYVDNIPHPILNGVTLDVRV